MRISKPKIVVPLVLVAVFCGRANPVRASADENGKNEPPAKRVAVKVEAPAPLTERERWLLDRVEELEKRVADLESKGNTTVPSAADAPAAQPASLSAATSAIAATPSVTAG